MAKATATMSGPDAPSEMLNRAQDGLDHGAEGPLGDHTEDQGRDGDAELSTGEMEREA